MRHFKVDYLLVGSGAMGMAFADILLAESDASVLIVDRYHQPGGHWTISYPFVQLHQPSAFYGVNSVALGGNQVYATGWNRGLYELATKREITSYFDQVMQRKFLPSGRVKYFPSCQYLGDGRFESLVSGQQYAVSYSKLVNSTFMDVVVPAMREPPFFIGKNVHCIPPDKLPERRNDYERWVVIGGGKTSIDVILFLLSHEVEPKSIEWVVPRDSWILDRAHIQPTLSSMGEYLSKTLSPGANAKSIGDFFELVSRAGGLLRIDESVTPTMYRCSTVSKAELVQLRRIENVVRMGRVKRINENEILLDGGKVVSDKKSIYIDCASNGLPKRKPVPIFHNDSITLQSVRTCQQVFSAALIAHLETNYSDTEEKNKLCRPIPNPYEAIDFLRCNVADWKNQRIWFADKKLQKWIENCRLHPSSHLINLRKKKGLIHRAKEIFMPDDANTDDKARVLAIQNIERLLKSFDEEPKSRERQIN